MKDNKYITLPESMQDYLSDETYRSRRNLMTVSTLLIITIIGNISIKEMSIWGSNVPLPQNTYFYSIILCVASYEMIRFISRRNFDYHLWYDRSPKAYVLKDNVSPSPEDSIALSPYDIMEKVSVLLEKTNAVAENSPNKGSALQMLHEIETGIQRLESVMKHYISIRKSTEKTIRRHQKFIELYIPCILYVMSLIVYLSNFFKCQWIISIQSMIAS